MLILLDIDGVMVPDQSWKAPEMLSDGFPVFSPRSIAGLRKIIAETGASILLTTSHKSRYTATQWKNIFASRGINASITKLKTNRTVTSRKDEVLSWTRTNKHDHNFVIIDDDKSLNGLPSEIKQRLILTSPLIGLNEALAEKAIETLLHDPELIRA